MDPGNRNVPFLVLTNTDKRKNIATMKWAIAILAVRVLTNIRTARRTLPKALSPCYEMIRGIDKEPSKAKITYNYMNLRPPFPDTDHKILKL